MPLTDDDFVKTGKLEGYSEMIKNYMKKNKHNPKSLMIYN